MGVSKLNVSDNLLRIPFFRYAVITVSLPAISLAYCFWSAYLFRSDEVNDTDCNVTNTIPSASAVTGIRPQAYVWRICIGLHTTPRFFVGIMYYNYYNKSLPHIKQNLQGLFRFLMRLCFFLYTVECSCLQIVSCISNKENYPLHEKIFIGFMVASIAHMVFGTILYRWSKYGPMTQLEAKSYFWKKFHLLWISLSTVGLLWFFFQHRVHCVPGAFSYFSVFEYMIAYANMGYHVTGYFDFYDKYLIAGSVSQPVTNGSSILSAESSQPVTNGSSILSEESSGDSALQSNMSNGTSPSPTTNGTPSLRSRIPVGNKNKAH
ncbi:post-GPI attachment to proteins factor 2-like [Dreissena polymorpha]|uniref:CWH43-like N-terminal domain-containing protein n=1 Tax=Dreissena polymorpha TaxID=45954 RepID=A0A9D4QKY3_DREPO|nr:post-GPI attachment to proteins factor 2-like [Dreissena polymorpha]KAH3834869.1 hypothetical protein DPMN_108202 [Dreissena polymorpha]